jgi:hypothetical protein
VEGLFLMTVEGGMVGLSGMQVAVAKVGFFGEYVLNWLSMLCTSFFILILF